MPIRPSEKHRYPADWPQIRERILARAHNRCEECGAPNYAWIYRDQDGLWHDVGHEALTVDDLLNGLTFKVIQVVLTIAHLDHTPENCDDDNLRAWCQYDHLKYDREYHRRNAARTRHARNGDLELPLYG